MDEMDNNNIFEEIIENESFIKNLKRMFITKQMEIHNINEVIIKFDKENSSFNFNMIKDEKKYEYKYEIKRRKKKKKANYDKKNIKQNIKIENHKTDETMDTQMQYSIRQNFKNNKNNSDEEYHTCLYTTNTNNNDCKYFINIIKSKRDVGHNKKDLSEMDKMYIRENIYNSRIKYNDNKNDILCKKLYRYIIIFMKRYNRNKSNVYQMVLKDIGNIFKTYGTKKQHCFLNLHNN